MFNSFILDTLCGFLVHRLVGTSAVPSRFPPQEFDTIPMLLIGCPVKFGIAAPPAYSPAS